MTFYCSNQLLLKKSILSAVFRSLICLSTRYILRSNHHRQSDIKISQSDNRQTYCSPACSRKVRYLLKCLHRGIAGSIFTTPVCCICEQDPLITLLSTGFYLTTPDQNTRLVVQQYQTEKNSIKPRHNYSNKIRAIRIHISHNERYKPK